MGRLGESSIFPKVAFVCLALALLLHFIAMGVPQWARSDPNKLDRREHIGLWKYCTYPVGGGQACGDFVDIIVGDWLKASQAFMILAMCALIGAVAVVALMAFVPDFEGDFRILSAGIAVSGTSALFTMITCGSFGAMYQQYFATRDMAVWGLESGQLYWGWGLALTDFFINLIAVGCLVVEVISNSQDAY